MHESGTRTMAAPTPTPPRRGVPSLAWRIAFALLAACLASSPPARAQTAAQRRRSPDDRRRPPLHNPNHEPTVRNLLHPRFKSNPLASGNHTSNVAIVVDSSRYWFNYRHATNALSIYHLLKRGGMPDENIVLMLADDIPCNMRNPFRGSIFPRGAKDGTGEDLMEGAEVDYAGTDVTVDAFLRVLLGRPLPGEGASASGGGRRSWPKLDEHTNVLVYLTGHGGDNFFKFQDGEELMSDDVASAFSQMRELGRYNQILFISDTCQAFTMADKIEVPNVYSIGSSLKGQNSYASHSDTEVGQSVIDRYSKIVKDFIDDAVALTSDPLSKNSDMPFDDATVAVMERLSVHDALVRVPMNHGELGTNSQVGHADHLCERRMNQVPLSDFFAASSSAREGMTERRGAKASLWMHGVPKVDIPNQPESDVDGECAVDGDPPSRTNADDDVGGQERKRPREATKGLSPSDPKFIAMTVGFLLLVSISSRIW
ncbi:hypothetical protein ACHAWF_007844 [Thalassiosira exigua]